MATYVLVSFLDDVHDGDEFVAAAWPLHLTLAPNFSLACDGQALAESLRPVVAGLRPLTALAAHEALFGPHHTVPVNVLVRTPELVSLHRELHDRLAAAGATFERPDYVSDGYRPHVTVQKHRRLQAGDEVRIDAVSIVEMASGGAPDRRKVVGTLRMRQDG